MFIHSYDEVGVGAAGATCDCGWHVLRLTQFRSDLPVMGQCECFLPASVCSLCRGQPHWGQQAFGATTELGRCFRTRSSKHVQTNKRNLERLLPSSWLAFLRANRRADWPRCSNDTEAPECECLSRKLDCVERATV